MGTHGRTGLSSLLMGSQAEQVVRAAPCAVITVKSPTSLRSPKEDSLRAIGRQAMEEAEKKAIIDTLQKNLWNRSKVSKALGINYKTLRIKIKKYRIQPR